MQTEARIHNHPIRDQVAGAFVDHINTQRLQSELNHLILQDQAFSKALDQILIVHDFVGSPENIIGSPLTKHGEIAEQVEVGVRNAHHALMQEDMTATFDGVGRTAPEDYLIDGIAVQSKFINGANNNLGHILDHMDKYPEFGRDDSYYHIPNDFYETILAIINNESTEQFAGSTIRAITEKVALIEEQTGKAFGDVVRPGISNYADVQQGKIHETLQQHESELLDTNITLKDIISENHQPSLNEAAFGAGMGAAAGGSVALTVAIYRKYKAGKSLLKGDFTTEDWKDIGITAGKGVTGGAVAGSVIYGLTNYTVLSAPFAAAVVSAAKSVSSLVEEYHSKNINFDQFVDLGMIVCAESAIVGICAATGQVLIPVPVLGAVIGSVAGQMLAQFTSSEISGIEKHLQEDMSLFLSKVNSAYADVVLKIYDDFEKLGELTRVAFSLEHNESLLMNSIQLARSYGIHEDHIIKNHAEIDRFMYA